MQDRPQSTAEKILQQREEADKETIIQQKEREVWREAVNRIIETPEGELFFSKMVKFIMPFADLRNVNPQTMAEINGSRTFYYKYVRPYLDKTNINKVE